MDALLHLARLPLPDFRRLLEGSLASAGAGERAAVLQQAEQALGEAAKAPGRARYNAAVLVDSAMGASLAAFGRLFVYGSSRRRCRLLIQAMVHQPPRTLGRKLQAQAKAAAPLGAVLDVVLQDGRLAALSAKVGPAGLAQQP